MCRQITISVRPVVLLTVVFLFEASPIHAETRIAGTPEALQLDADDASIEEVLDALGSRFGLRYRSTSVLVRRITGTYKGSLEQVVKRLLDGFDYVIKTNSDAGEIIILGPPKKGGTAEVPVVTRRRSD